MFTFSVKYLVEAWKILNLLSSACYNKEVRNYLGGKA